ncbi:sulfotransferase family protein [Desulfospira joergensenii]|uniref:sulfotransferase family protein n=1 Tax=Desulfospira joergensenii TaxID=53329 RepID=UPI0003B6FD91|nr:sulfotransferase [Desulfospira joergensenii]
MAAVKNIYKLIYPEIRRKNALLFRYWLKGIYWEFTKPVEKDPVFLIGCSRSGTTVTYETLMKSSKLKTFGFEIPQFWTSLWGPNHNDWESEAAGAEHVQDQHRYSALKYFYQRIGPGQVLDKTCINILRVGFLNKLFPKARFIYIHRDGRDNINSLIEGWRLGDHFGLEQFYGNFPHKIEINDGEFTQWRFFIPPGWKGYNKAPIEDVCAFQWMSANSMAIEAKKIIPENQWIQIRYENLFTHAEEIFRDVFNKLGLPFEDSIRKRCQSLLKHPTSIVKGQPELGKWRTQNPKEIEKITDKIRPIQKILGYN